MVSSEHVPDHHVGGRTLPLACTCHDRSVLRVATRVAAQAGTKVPEDPVVRHQPA
jgi:hypothetical protein